MTDMGHAEPFGVRYIKVTNRVTMFILLLAFSIKGLFLVVVIASGGIDWSFHLPGAFLMLGEFIGWNALERVNRQINQGVERAGPEQVFWSLLFISIVPIGTVVYGPCLYYLLKDPATIQALGFDRKSKESRQAILTGLAGAFCLFLVVIYFSSAALNAYGKEFLKSIHLESWKLPASSKKIKKPISEILLKNGQTVTGAMTGEDNAQYFVEVSGQGLVFVNKDEISSIHPVK